MIESENIIDIRNDFPILNRKIHGKPLIYFDNAASNQKPMQVLDAITNYYANDYSNIHRGVHTLSQLGTTKYEEVRDKVKDFINASKREEIVFTKGTTDGLNLLANSLGKTFLKKGDQVLISTLEHHSNIVPWQMICEVTGASLQIIPISRAGEINVDAYIEMLNDKVKIVSINHISNTLGTINPIKKMIKLAHKKNIITVIDGAQAVAHKEVNMQDLDADFYVFSAHKLFGPTGVGVLYGKERYLEKIPPYQGGGDMINQVSFEKTSYNDLPYKFEAGTPNIAGVVGLGAAIDYVNEIGLKNIEEIESELLQYATEKLNALPFVNLFGTAKQKAAVISFIVKDAHPYDVGTLLDGMGIAVRTGHHCTQPLMDFYKIPGTIRASFAMYNSIEEIDRFIAGLIKVKSML